MYRNKTVYIKIFLGVSVCAFVLIFSAAISTATAATATDIQTKIAANNQQIADLQKQIDAINKSLNSTSKQAQTLTKALSDLTLTQKKLQVNLSLTTQQISKTGLTLTQLNTDISHTEAGIQASVAVIAESMREINQTESQSVIEELLSNKSISDTWDYINAVRTLQNKISSKINDLKDLNDSLNAKKDEATGQKTKLESYQKSLSDQQKVVASTKQEKDKLLADTKNQESTYKALLADKIKQQIESQKELADYESQLNLVVDPGTLPSARKGLLAWPLDAVTVTQYFGYTADAARLYKTTAKHNGIDLRASIGTEVKAALTGVVWDIATYARSGCQYGRYVLIKHPNGISTIYAHLSVVSVVPGQSVMTGDRIGFSGDTGYATGPHLHFGLYATDGIQIVPDVSLPRSAGGLGQTSCRSVRTVGAVTSAYLDPIPYLSAI
jgi:murein DD-endopeptidase MepM/ murein hydrolase activator NlpD